MDATNSTVLVVLYLILSVVILYGVFCRIKKHSFISLKSFFELYFFLVYGLTPIISLVSFQNPDNVHEFYFTMEPKYYYFLFAITVLFYAVYKFSAFFFEHRKSTNRLTTDKKTKWIDVSSNRFFFVTLILSLIGLISLFLWSKAFGFPWDVIKYANAIRSGRSPIQNNLTFFKPFCSFMIIAFYNNVIMLKKTKFKIMNIMLLVINLTFSIIFLLGNDSRMFILVFFLCLILYFKNKNVRLSLKTFFVYLSIAGLAIFVLGELDNFTYYLRNNSVRETDNNAIESGLSEFAFTYRNGVNVLYFYDNDMLPEMHEAKDLKNIVTAWLPERFKLGREYLGDLNTSYYYNATGGIPTDIITASIYKFHLLGLVLMPVFVAGVLDAIERFLTKRKSEFTVLIYNLIGCSTCLRIIAYYDLSNILSSSFYIIISTCMVLLFCSSSKKKENCYEDNKLL